MSRKKEKMGEAFHIRLPKEVENRAEQLAKKRYMSVTATLRCLIAERLDQLQKSPPSDAQKSQ